MADQLRCILVGLTGEEGFTTSPALDFAIALAGRESACLTVCAIPPPVYLPIARRGGSAATVMEAELRHLEIQTLATARAAAKRICEAGVDCISEQSFSMVEHRTGHLVRAARVNDVCVLDASNGDSAQRTAIEDVLFDSGRPVLVVPRQGGSATPRRVAIAWDGSARSARAVDDAISFLRNADAVFVVTVTGEKDLSRMAPGADLAGYLARHGVPEARLEMLSAADGDVSERLREFIADERIEMLVMGAFVHSRFRQAILGGVTRSLLDEAPVPIFMAH
jgi:nucleotide-binding universal stress UspA family protein